MEFIHADSGQHFEPKDEMLKDYYEDNYDQFSPLGSEEEMADYDYDEILGHMPGFAPFTLEQILEECIEPTMKDGLKHIGKVIIWCIIFRVFTQSTSRMPSWLRHLSSCVTGLLVLAHFFYTNVQYQIALSAVSLISLHFVHRWLDNSRGLAIAVVCVTFNTFCELYYAQPVEWHQVRGVQMVLSMKVISLAFDMDADVKAAKEKAEEQRRKNVEEEEHNVSDHEEKPRNGKSHTKGGRKRNNRQKHENAVDKKDSKMNEGNEVPVEQFDMPNVPTVLEYFGYTLCPGNSIFGPWLPFKDYLGIYENPRWNATWFIKIIFSMMIGFMFLTVSTCWLPWFIPENGLPMYLAYRTAGSFRCSQYFVNYVAEASAVAAGFGCLSKADDAGPAAWSVQVTKPQNIEVPRSLVEVVVEWNIPMHKWLKTYCFKKTIKYGKWMAVMTTFLASTFLHGFNFQLGAVLLSLGFFTYTENKLRSRLATIFDASIGARRDSGGSYRHKEGEFLVMVANSAFCVMAVFHLMYLGVMFDQQDLQVEGYEWRHTIAKWEAMGYASHWIMLATFAITFAI